MTPEDAANLGKRLIARAAASRLGQPSPEDARIFDVARILDKALEGKAMIRSITHNPIPGNSAYRDRQTGELINIHLPGKLITITLHKHE